MSSSIPDSFKTWWSDLRSAGTRLDRIYFATVDIALGLWFTDNQLQYVLGSLQPQKGRTQSPV